MLLAWQHTSSGRICTKSFAFALRACISEGVLYMNCLYRPHFQHDRLIPSLWRARLRIRLFESKSVLTDGEATLASKLSELKERPSFRPVACSISVMLARNMFEDSSFLKKFPPSQTSF